MGTYVDTRETNPNAATLRGIANSIEPAFPSAAHTLRRMAERLDDQTEHLSAADAGALAERLEVESVTVRTPDATTLTYEADRIVRVTYRSAP